ncbi:MAG: AMP-binding protein [Acidimicrobiia bacterium]|nr:AMP-binding protein [Acidimicrobiia bacterium]
MPSGSYPTLASRWFEAVAAVPSRPFLVWEGPDGSTNEWNYRDFDALIGRVAAGLAQHGVKPGDGVHLALANSPAFVAIWLACATRLGAWMVPSDPRATSRELGEHIDQTHPRVGICSDQRAASYHDAATSGLDVIEVSEEDIDVEPLLGQLQSTLPVTPDPLDRAAVMFTSGTTSAPKGVVVTQANYAFAGDVMAAAAALTQEDRQLVVLPLFHANAQYYSFASAISAGASVALMSRFSASRFLDQVDRHSATHASLFAAPLRMILASAPSPLPHDSALRHVWYAQNVTDDQYEELVRLFGCRPRQLYGMTETIPAVLTNRPLDPLPNAMGEVTLGCEVDLHPSERTGAVPAGAEGEIVVRGIPGITLFAEYLDAPELTTAAYHEDWFHTGDRAWRDDQGLFHFAGRDSDILKVSGENVSVVEIEEVLATHGSVLEAAVVGKQDPVRDEVPVAYVVQAPNAPAVDLDELAVFCENRLSPSKRPHHITLVDELPRTSVGKIRKFMFEQQDQGAAT